MVGPGKVATSLAADPPRLYPQMVCAGMLVSEVILKFGFALMRSTKYFCGGYVLKNWKQSDPGTSEPLNWPRPSNGRPVAGLIALLGQMVGFGCNPGSVSGRACNCGGIGSGSTKTRAGCGLHPGLQSPGLQLAQAWVKPTVGMRMPAPVISPIFIRSRRVNPAFTSSNLFFRAFCIVFHCAREIL